MTFELSHHIHWVGGTWRPHSGNITNAPKRVLRIWRARITTRSQFAKANLFPIETIRNAYRIARANPRWPYPKRDTSMGIPPLRPPDIITLTFMRRRTNVRPRPPRYGCDPPPLWGAPGTSYIVSVPHDGANQYQSRTRPPPPTNIRSSIGSSSIDQKPLTRSAIRITYTGQTDEPRQWRTHGARAMAYFLTSAAVVVRTREQGPGVSAYHRGPDTAWYDLLSA